LKGTASRNSNRRNGSHVIPNAHYELAARDVLIVLTPEGALEKLEKEE